ncbi:hypothetical protein [Nitrosopumilus piranensis]|uniref:Uncharacterized protein n=1 Tax=Nitrosopumilus piranensis TaxID=1582439 RepID=A0A0C5C177_9ARCH|nr:hypothetical protein [Nitrosopumilus piranensis]AJM93085.1 hypothetical protein NPIRD3C_1875 [Nitrosopumilus piranensis]
MSLTSDSLIDILSEIKKELTNQISLANNNDKKIDTRKLLQQSKILDDAILTSEITEEHKSMLQKFSLTLHDSESIKSLRYEKQDLQRVIDNLNDDDVF